MKTVAQFMYGYIYIYLSAVVTDIACKVDLRAVSITDPFRKIFLIL